MWDIKSTFLILAAISIGVLGCGPTRRPTTYIVPAGFSGQVRVRYGVGGSPALPIVRGAFQVRVPSSGEVVTATAIEYGLADDRYYRTDVSEANRLYEGGEATRPGDPPRPRSIWNSEVTVDSKAGTYVSFFVGSEAQHDTYEANLKAGKGKPK